MLTAHKRCSYYWWQLSFYKQLGFLVGLGVGRDAGLEKFHYLQWEERKTYSDGEIQSPSLRLKTLSPPPPSLVSLLPTPFILSSSFPSSHPQAIILTRIVLSKGCGQAGTPILLVLTHDVNLICIPPLYTSSLAPPQPCFCWFQVSLLDLHTALTSSALQSSKQLKHILLYFL